MQEARDMEKDITLDAGNYEVLQNRLRKNGAQLNDKLDQLNAERKSVFRTIDTKLLATERITTENNCLPRDMVSIENTFIFGYNVHIGLKSETKPEDVFSIYQYEDHLFHTTSLDLISDSRFIEHFQDLYKYYKNARFAKFYNQGPFLYMVFRVGKRVSDIKAFKWHLNETTLQYIDNRSEHEVKYPAQHEFEWTRTHRDLHREGKYPHISIDDRLFVETLHGELTLKIEDNTEYGEGIYSEPVENKDQKLDDAEVFYAILGELILLKIKPYQEHAYRYFVYNEKIHEAVRIDEISDSCVRLPDDHGLIFSNGYYLQSGEYKIYDYVFKEMMFEKRISSSNGEDWLYLFYNRDEGNYILLNYNLIERKLLTPTMCHGYAFFPNGEMVYFRSENEPQKHHAVQIWQTPYATKQNEADENKLNPFYKIGNKDIVRFMAEANEIVQLIEREDVYERLYLDLVKLAIDLTDSFFWLAEPYAFGLKDVLLNIHENALATVEEFEKMLRIRTTTSKSFAEVERACKELLSKTKRPEFETLSLFVEYLSNIRSLRGELISLKDLRYIDLELVSQLELEIKERAELISASCVHFLLQENSLDSYNHLIRSHSEEIKNVSIGAQAKELLGKINQVADDLELLTDIVSNLKIDDPNKTTEIIDRISDLYTTINQNRTRLKKHQKEITGSEAKAEFSAQLKLVKQAVSNYLEMSDSVEKLEGYSTKLMIQIEELEGKFAEYDDFTLELADIREDVFNAFESRKVHLSEQKNKRATTLYTAAERILAGIQSRVTKCQNVAEINSYFASDLMIEKFRSLILELSELGDSVKSDELETRLKSLREETVRQLKDKTELFVDGKNIIRFGEHLFSVNTQPLQSTIVQKSGTMYFHLSGTNFYEPITNKEFLQTEPVWNQEFISENETVYRSEYLAYHFVESLKVTHTDLAYSDLLGQIQVYASQRYEEGYVKGIHDVDAAKIAFEYLNLKTRLGVLKYPPEVRAFGNILWNVIFSEDVKAVFKTRFEGLKPLFQLFPERNEWETIIYDLKSEIENCSLRIASFETLNYDVVAEYLFYELAIDDAFVISSEASTIYNNFVSFLIDSKNEASFYGTLEKLNGNLTARYDLIYTWIKAYSSSQSSSNASFIYEAAALVYCKNFDPKRMSDVSFLIKIEGLNGDHQVIQKNNYEEDFLTFVHKLKRYNTVDKIRFKDYLALKKSLSESFKQEIRLEEFKPRVLTSFVRNKLINEVYLPLIGDNLAKQMGTAGKNSRTDRMGLLLLISPPGYGKTTLMEYIADRLGLVFMKINGPAIGHHVTSLDPAEAPNASAREELKKLNLSLEMGDNVMLYLDDIQHCNPELLQKFISLCDGQRRIEGVYKGNPKTYDLRGRKVCVVMAGNPYTETGEKFQVPDMLSNRADTYNLGDIIGDSYSAFEMSYIENCMSSNSVLNRILARSSSDIYVFLRICLNSNKGELEFEGSYTPDEISEITSVINKLFIIRDIVLKVNKAYIKSAAQSDDYRTEPPFKLQGSYRNMAKLAEKVMPVMNDDEILLLIKSHYEQESQLLTSDAEANILKLKEMNDWLTDEDVKRWELIKLTFQDNLKKSGNGHQAHLNQLIEQFSFFNQGIEGIKEAIEKSRRN